MLFTEIIRKIFGTQNDRIVKNYANRVKKINALEEHYEKLSDEALQEAFTTLKSDVRAGTKSLDVVLNDVFAITREASKRTTGMRHFDVQMIGGLVLHDGNIAEMKTGEGKTLVATLPVVLNAMSGEGVHVVTVNDYLAKRDAADMSRIYNFLGLSVGVVTNSLENDAVRKEQYLADIT